MDEHVLACEYLEWVFSFALAWHRRVGHECLEGDKFIKHLVWNDNNGGIRGRELGHLELGGDDYAKHLVKLLESQTPRPFSLGHVEVDYEFIEHNEFHLVLLLFARNA